jgi:ferredoxin
MSLLTLDIAKCVRTTNKFSECRECVSACPVETIKINEQLPSFVPNDCVGCGGCLSACPSDAYSLDDFNPMNFIFSVLESQKQELSCKKDNIPCLAALSVEELLSLTLLSPKDIKLDKTPCYDCEIAKHNLKIIEDRVEEVSFLVEAMGVENQLSFENLSSVNIDSEESNTSDRREFLSKISIHEAAKAKYKFDNKIEALDEELREHTASVDDIQSIRDKTLPDRRNLLKMAMKRAGVPDDFHIIESEDISFISQKVLDEATCTNCQMCYRICPTGALSSDKYGGFIAFDALNCIKCASCHDVCEPNSLTIKETFNLKELYLPKRETLVSFNVKRCDECGMPFVYRGGEMMCTRCRIEEEEANELWGIK